jgi:hypothetical protein
VAYVMGVRRRPPADGAGLGCHIVMLLATDPPRLTDGQYAFVNFCCVTLRRLRGRGALGDALTGIVTFGKSNRAVLEMSD